MGYDIELKNRYTGERLEFASPHRIRSNNVPAAMQDGRLVQIPQREARCGITYNYSGYYYEATENDIRFLVEEDGKTGNGGIRGIYGVSAEESLPMLADMVKRIRAKYIDDNGEWLTAKRSRMRYYTDKTMKTEVDMLDYFRLPEDTRTSAEEEYTVSEGDTSNYWEETAANAIIALQELMFIATQCAGMDGVWEGD